jgi:hypothetical protein
MLINEILFEDAKSRSQVLDRDGFKKLLPQLSIALKQQEAGNRIYRGTPNQTSIIYVDPTTSERASRNTTNQYNLLFSHVLPSWKNWPKRSRALICSGDYNTARSYSTSGSPYIVLPLDNPNIGVCPYYDFWDSFEINPNTFNDLFIDFYKSFRMFYSEEYPKINWPESTDDLESLLQTIKLVEKLSAEDPRTMAKVVDDFESGWGSGRRTLSKIFTSGDIINKLSKFYDPKKNGFILTPYSSYQSTTTEVWVSAPCILIKPSAFDSLVN